MNFIPFIYVSAESSYTIYHVAPQANYTFINRGILFINGLRSGPTKQTGEEKKEANSSATDGVKLLEI